MRTSRGWRWWISRRLLWLFFVLFRQRRQYRLVLENVRGIPLVVLPGVFHPVLFLSTSLLLDAIEESKLGVDSLVLDLGTGTGVCAIAAARMGAQVTATDISPIAVRCARANVLVSNLEDRVRVLEGDLFEPVGSERFGLVIFNPPYFKGKPVDWTDYAWRGEGVFQRFLEGLSVHLTRRGKVLISVSTELDLEAIKNALLEKRFVVREIRKRKIPGETLYVYECAPSNP